MDVIIKLGVKSECFNFIWRVELLDIPNSTRDLIIDTWLAPWPFSALPLGGQLHLKKIYPAVFA